MSTRVRLLPVREQEGCRLPGREDSLWFSFPTMNEDVTCCCHGQIVSLWSLSGISDNLCFNRRKYSHHFVTCASPREAWVLSSWLFPTLWDPMDHSPPGSSVHGFSRQEHWSGWPFPSPGDLADPGIQPLSLMPLALAGGFFTTSTTLEAPPKEELLVKPRCLEEVMITYLAGGYRDFIKWWGIRIKGVPNCKQAPSF